MTQRKSVCLEFHSTYEMLDFVQVASDHLGRLAGLDDDALHWVGVAVRESEAYRSGAQSHQVPATKPRAPERVGIPGRPVQGEEGERRARAPLRHTRPPVRHDAPPGDGPGGLARSAQQLGDLLGIKVKVAHSGSGGAVTLHYSSLDQLDMICQRLSGEPI